MRNLLASPLQERYRLVHFEAGSRGKESPAKDENILAKVLRILTSPFALAWCIVRLRVSVVHLNSALDHKAFWRDLVYLLVCKMLGRKVVFQLHGGWLGDLCTNRWMRWITRAAFSIPDAIVLLATVEIREFAEIGITARVTVIANGVDVSKYCKSGREHSGNAQRFIYLGRLIRAKGIFEVIEAVETLRAEGREVELRIAGSGPAREEIERYIHEHRLDGSVKLVGTVYGDSKIEFLRGADLLMFPTYHREGLPYCILESMAAGTPVVATGVAGIPDVLIDGVHGVLVKPRDAGDVVRAVRQLSSSKAALRAMSRNCIDWAKARLGLERLARDFGDLYEKLSA